MMETTSVQFYIREKSFDTIYYKNVSYVESVTCHNTTESLKSYACRKTRITYMTNRLTFLELSNRFGKAKSIGKCQKIATIVLFNLHVISDNSINVTKSNHFTRIFANYLPKSSTFIILKY